MRDLACFPRLHCFQFYETQRVRERVNVSHLENGQCVALVKVFLKNIILDVLVLFSFQNVPGTCNCWFNGDMVFTDLM